MNTNTTLLTEETVKELSQSLYAINGLHKELDHERKSLISAVSQMTLVSRQLPEHLKSLEGASQTLQDKIEKTMTRETKQMVNLVSAEAGSLFKENVSSHVTDVIQKLTYACEQARLRVDSDNKKSRFSFKYVVGMSLVATTLGMGLGGTLVHNFMPPIDDQMRHQLEMGKTFQKIWQHLSLKEREKLIASYKEKATNSLEK